MPNNKSSKKRNLIAKRNRLKNRSYVSPSRKLIKSFLKKLKDYRVSKDSKDIKNAEKILSSIYSLIDKGTKRKIFHQNYAARMKSRLTKKLLNQT